MQQTLPSTRSSPRLSNRKSANTSPKEPPKDILASPNAFDWPNHLLQGSSPAAFTFSLSPRTGNQQLYEYPKDQHHDHSIKHQSHHHHQQQQQHQADLETIMLLNQVHPGTVESILGIQNGDYLSDSLSVASSGGVSTPSSFLNPLEPRRSYSDRRDAHRESERRRRESMKSALATLESLVMLAIDHIDGQGGNRKLSHAEIYSTAREMIMALKEQVSSLEAANAALKAKK